MSDGPHKSLGMRKGWNKFAERADKPVYEQDQVAEALHAALAGDWRAERCDKFVDEIRKAIGDDGQKQKQLFEKDKKSKLDALKKLTGAGYRLRRMLLDNAQLALESGSTADTILEATKNTILDGAGRGIRDVEEHWRRKTTERRTARVRDRLENCVTPQAIDSIARKLLKMDSAVSPAPVKRDGLDEGVRL